MTSSTISETGQRSRKLWLPSLLLLAQFLTITPVLLIVFADEQQRVAATRYVTLLDQLDRLSSAIPETEGEGAWQQQYSADRGDLNGILANSPSPQLHESLARVDSIVERMAAAQTDAAGFRKDSRAAHAELLDAQRQVRAQLSITGNDLSQKTAYLRALVAGACLLALGVVVVIRKFRIDVTIQRKSQQQLQTSNEEVTAALATARSEAAAKNQFLAHVGNLMRDGAHAGGDFAESLARIASQVADYSRMESGSFELQSVEFEPASVVAEVMQQFALAAERKGLRIRSSMGKGLPTVVKGDPERLRQVLATLLSNAIRFTQQGGVSIRLESAMVAEGKTSLRFRVSDTGIGITEQARNRIFQPFNHANGAEGEGNEGTGLGLAISKRLVELMGGRIEFTSKPGRGSIFFFTAVFENAHVASEPLPIAGAGPVPAADAIEVSGNGASLTTGGKRERRTEPRHRTNYATLLRSEDAGIAIIRVLDVSASGLRVSVPFRLDLHTEVEIRIEGTSVAGIVQSCTCIRANEFHVGIELPTAVSSSEQSQQHLRLLRTARALHRS